MGLLIRGIFCAFSRTGLNLVEVALPEQKLSVITGHNEFEILEETGDYKWLKNGNREGLQWIRSIICSIGHGGGGTENHCNPEQFTWLDQQDGNAESD